VRENPKRRAQHTKTGNKCKQAQAAPKESINSTIRLFFGEQTLCDEFLEDLSRGKWCGKRADHGCVGLVGIFNRLMT
jgi:hypothetical protein